MFGSESIKNSMSGGDNSSLDIDISFKSPFLDWDELKKKGVVKQSVDTDGDFVYIRKEFISFDKTWKKCEEIILSKEGYDEILQGRQQVGLTEVERDNIRAKIEGKREEIEHAVIRQEFEKCQMLKEEITVLQSQLDLDLKLKEKQKNG